MSSTTRRGESITSALAINSRLSVARPARFSSCVSSFRLERLQARSQGCPTLPDLLGADEPKGWILRHALGVVDILIPGQSAVHRLPQQVDQRQLGILAPAGIGQVPFHEFAQAQTHIQLAHQNQTTVGSHSRALEVDHQGAVEGELKGLFLRLTHRLSSFTPPQSHSNPREWSLFKSIINLVVNK